MKRVKVLSMLKKKIVVTLVPGSHCPCKCFRPKKLWDYHVRGVCAHGELDSTEVAFGLEVAPGPPFSPAQLTPWNRAKKGAGLNPH